MHRQRIDEFPLRRPVLMSLYWTWTVMAAPVPLASPDNAVDSGQTHLTRLAQTWTQINNDAFVMATISISRITPSVMSQARSDNTLAMALIKQPLVTYERRRHVTDPARDGVDLWGPADDRRRDWSVSTRPWRIYVMLMLKPRSVRSY